MLLVIKPHTLICMEVYMEVLCSRVLLLPGFNMCTPFLQGCPLRVLPWLHEAWRDERMPRRSVELYITTLLLCINYYDAKRMLDSSFIDVYLELIFPCWQVYQPFFPNSMVYKLHSYILAVSTYLGRLVLDCFTQNGSCKNIIILKWAGKGQGSLSHSY